MSEETESLTGSASSRGENQSLLGSSDESENRTVNRKQCLCLILMAYGYFCIAAGGSLQGPFFPGQCDIKGVSPLVYGSIFGAFELFVILTRQISDKTFAYIAPHSVLRFGLFLVGSTIVLFGVLDKVIVAYEFTIFALFLRIGEGIGVTAFTASCYALMKSEFSDLAVPPFAAWSFASSLGSLLGPLIGGALFMAGGYVVPFAFFGSLLIFGGLISILILPKPDNYTVDNPVSFHSHSQLIVLILSGGCVALTGFNDATLAHHLSQFDLSPIQIGSIFIIIGLTNYLCSNIWLKLRKVGLTASWIAILGTVFNIIGLLLIGPASFLPIEPKLWLIIISLIIIGIGLAGKHVGSCLSTRSANDEVPAINNLTSVAAVVGPVTGGLLIGTVGYRASTQVFLVLEIFTLILLIVHKIHGS